MSTKTTSTNTHQRSEQTKRNRRFKHLQSLAQDPSTKPSTDPAFYFSDYAMRTRDPALFDQFIGRHIPSSERQRPFSNSVPLVDRMFHDIDEREYLEKLGVDVDGVASGPKAKLEEEVADDVEFDSDDEDGRIMHQRARVQNALNRSLEHERYQPQVQSQQEHGEYVEEVSLEERNVLRLELVRIMKERFLDGRDGEFFDYAFVDDDSDLDDMDTATRDAQEEYFDKEEEFDDQGMNDGEAGVSTESGGKGRTRTEWAAVWAEKGSVNNAEYDF
ncbi:coiled-coil domain-containing protein-domain-containing protein [Obelidium mucronatum]|nr:coiled-coil domain-containing protein-domain-containing protein [Obelidium mucronatum]